MKNRMPRGLKFALIAIAAPIVIALILALFGWVVMSLWNWLLPGLFGWKIITFWQAVGLVILCRLLFGGMRGGGGPRWRHRMSERWQHMTPEEREKLRQEMGSRWVCSRQPEPETKPGA
ncbi:MAG: hypothetical protein ACLQHF_13090 [Terracidiphilus sp.]